MDGKGLDQRPASSEPDRGDDGADAPASHRLVDPFGREVAGLRISLTDRCNLDCSYCHNEGLGRGRCPGPTDDEMSVDQVAQIARVAYAHGIREFKLTGGEPMLREDLEAIVSTIAALPDVEVSLTTNGLLLPDRADDLARNGLERVNVSMDAPDAEAYREITGGPLAPVREGVAAAVDAGLAPVKLNMVMTAEIAEHLDDMIAFASDRDGVHLQLIEFMPELVEVDVEGVDIDDVRSRLREMSDGVETREMHSRDRYHVDGTTVEVVDPVGNPEFCRNCHRIRVTPEGELKACLNRPEATVPTADASDADLVERFERVTAMRVPYYGEYMVRGDDGDWVRNPRYAPGVVAPDGGPEETPDRDAEEAPDGGTEE